MKFVGFQLDGAPQKVMNFYQIRSFDRSFRLTFEVELARAVNQLRASG